MRASLAAGAAAGAAAALLAVGCATLAPLPRAEREYAGRFSVVTSLGDKRDTGSGRFSLAVQGRAVALDLSSSLGTTLARIELDGNGARLTVPGRSGPREVRGPDAEALTYEVLGWPLPVAGIGDWIQGVPVPAQPFQALGEAAGFEQDGWKIAVLERFAGAESPPRLLRFERQEIAGVAPAISLRLVLDEPPRIR